MNRKFLASLIFAAGSVFFVSAQNVNERELRSAGDASTIVFENYEGPHSVIETAAAINSIGAGLGNQLKNAGTQSSGTFGANGKYTVIHAVDSSEQGKLDADIIIINPNATVEVVWTRTWFDPAVEKQAALELLNRGCDLLEQHQDTTAPQIAAQEKGALAIGYNVPTPNAAPKAYLTAPLFNWPVFYTANVQALLDGKWEGKAYWEGIDQGWVGLDALSALCVPGTQEAVDVAMEAMKAKTFEPFTGPLFDQDGTEKIPSGVMMTDDDIWNMSWFVKGVIGSTN